MMWWFIPALLGLVVLWCSSWIVADRLREMRPNRMVVTVTAMSRRFPDHVPRRLRISIGDAATISEMAHYATVTSGIGGSVDVQVDRFTYQRLRNDEDAILIHRRTFWRARLVPLDVIPRLDS